jgi:hypothetical protein
LRIRIIVPLLNRGGIVKKVQTFLNELHEERPEFEIMKSKSALPSRARNEGIFGRYIDLMYPGSLLQHDVYAFLDGDVLPTVKAYLSVLDDADVNTFSTGVYPTRGGKSFAFGEFKGGMLISYRNKIPPTLDHVGWAGGGLLFVGANVLRSLNYPYFHETVVSWKDDQNIARAAIFGEDVAFCLKARQRGFKLALMHGLIAEHLTEEDA